MLRSSVPYLFNADGTHATRSVIKTVSATTLRNGASVIVTTGGPVGSFAIIRHGTSTHTVNTDQRRIPPGQGVSVGTNQYRVTIPSDSGVALPGYWMLFALNSKGVPSQAQVILITL